MSSCEAETETFFAKCFKVENCIKDVHLLGRPELKIHTIKYNKPETQIISSARLLLGSRGSSRELA